MEHPQPRAADLERSAGDGNPGTTDTTRRRPWVVCLCGSARFLEAFDDVSIQETLAGHIVLSIASTRRTDAEILNGFTAEQAGDVLTRLGELHRAKIDMADEVVVINVGGYVGTSTRQEIAYATERGKSIRFLSPAEHRTEPERPVV